MTAETDALRLVPAAFAPIETAPRDGTIFLACNLDHPSFGVWPVCRRVKHTFNDQGWCETTDLGAWLHLGSIEPDYNHACETGPEPAYSVAPDDLNTSVRYGWTPLVAAAPAVQPAAGMEEIARWRGENIPYDCPYPSVGVRGAPYGYNVDPGAGSAMDRLQRNWPDRAQIIDLRARDGEITPLFPAILAALAHPPAQGSEERYKAALEEIVSPVAFMQRRAKADGRQLSGMAHSIANSASYLQGIANAALSHPGPASEGEAR